MKKKRKKITLIALALVLAALIGYTAWSTTALEANSFIVCDESVPKSFDGYVIAQVSDLHNAEFGVNNAELLALLADAKPDMIAITGDLVDSRHTNMEVSLRFAAEAAALAPTYYVPGNHEARLPDYARLRDRLTQAGVIVLENKCLALHRGDDAVTLCGMSDPAFFAAPDGTLPAESIEFLRGIGKSAAAYSILLAHRPEFFAEYAESGVGLILAGHAHGGQLRLPPIGAIYAPTQGFFPKYTSGLYTEYGSAMVVSRGLGNSIIPFRFCNRPELVLVTLRTAG